MPRPTYKRLFDDWTLERGSFRAENFLPVLTLSEWMRFFHLLALVGAFASAASLSAGTVLFDNVGEASAGADDVDFVGPLYDSFTSTSLGQITSLQLVLGSDGDTKSSGEVQVGLYADNSTTPGQLIAWLGSVDDSSLSTAPATYSITLDTDPVLASQTLYWIGLTGISSAEWYYGSDASGVGIADEFFANQMGVFSNDNGPYQMSVTEGVVAPEPSNGVLMIIGAGILLAIVCHRALLVR